MITKIKHCLIVYKMQKKVFDVHNSVETQEMYSLKELIINAFCH